MGKGLYRKVVIWGELGINESDDIWNGVVIHMQGGGMDYRESPESAKEKFQRRKKPKI